MCQVLVNPYFIQGEAHKARILYSDIIIGNWIIIPYPRERGPMGGALYIGPRLGDGLIFEVSVSCLDAKERLAKFPTLSS